MSDSPIIAFLNKVTDLILLNILWLLCSLPIITAGAATTAMYYVCITSIRCGDGYVVKRFFKSFKENFKQITPIWICILVFCALLVFNIIFWAQIGWDIANIMQFINGIIGTIGLVYIMWLFPVYAKLSGTNKNLLKNAAAFAVGYLPYTGVILCITVFVIWANLKSVIANSIMLFIGFALLAYMQSFFFYRVFLKHIDEKLYVVDDLDSKLQHGGTEQ